MSIFQADLLRLSVGLAAGWSLIMTMAILFAFTSRVGWGFGWRSIEDRKKTHIFLVSASFVVLSGYAIAEVYLRVGTPLTWRGPVLLVGFLIAGSGQYSMLSAQMKARHEYHGKERRRSLAVPTEPVLALIDRVMSTLDRIESRQVRIEDRQRTGADSMARMEDAANHVASDLESSQARADTVTDGAPGAAADAGAQSGRDNPTEPKE